MPLERKIVFYPAYDRSQQTPSYGIHGMVIDFQLHGPEGTVNWPYHTGIYLAHTRKRLGKYEPSSYGTEICAHSSKSFNGSDSVRDGNCPVLGGIPCYSIVLTGCLYGRELGEKLLLEGDEIIWKELEEYYYKLFPQQELALTGATKL